MTQNVPLNVGDPALEPFFDATQEMLSGAATNFALTLLNPTTIRVPAGTGHDQVSLSIQGQYRFVTAAVDRSFPGGAAGTYIIFATAAANDGTTKAPPANNYTFALAIVASGGGPPVGVDLYRQVGHLTWNGSSITTLVQDVQAVGGAQLKDTALVAGSVTVTRQPDGGLLLQLADNAVTAAKVAAALKPSAGAAAGTEALRALGTTASTAAPGNDPRFPDDARLFQPGDLKASVLSGQFGWLYCDGTSKLRTDYPALFAAIGTQYGAVDSTHFNVPDLRGRFPLGTSGGHPMGQTGGAETVALASGEMPAHTHTTPGHTHSSAAHTHARGAHTHDPPSSAHYLADAGGVHWAYGSSTPTGADINLVNPPSTGSGGPDTGSTMPADTGSAGSGSTGSQGSGTAHNNMPPFVVVQWFIKI